MAAVRHLGFLQVRDFNYPFRGQYASPCQILCKSFKALWRYGRFRLFKMVAVRHLGFYKLEILIVHTLCRANVRHRAKFCADRLRRCGDTAVFDFFKMAAFRHFGFFIRSFGLSTKCILVVSVTVRNLVWIGRVVRKYASFNILSVKLKNAHSRPFRGCLGVKNLGFVVLSL